MPAMPALPLEWRLALRRDGDWVACGMLAAAAVVFPLSLAPIPSYGKLQSPDQHRPSYICRVNARAAWLCQELPALAIPAALLVLSRIERRETSALWRAACSHLAAENPGPQPTTRLHGAVLGTLRAMFLAHYANRALVYPFQLRDPAPFPLHLTLAAGVFCTLNGWMQGRALAAPVGRLAGFARASPGPSMAMLAAGTLLFCTGFAINLDSDARLRALRATVEDPEPTESIKASGTVSSPSSSPSPPSSSPPSSSSSSIQTSDGGATPASAARRARRYKIPRGGAFEWVSAANLFGEMVEWTGFAIASGLSPAPTCFALFTIANLAPRAWRSHHWYMDRFGAEYARLGRAAVIPLIW
jgi:3-oxo-5-alpha-steroid 4-dehydrogenase 1